MRRNSPLALLALACLAPVAALPAAETPAAKPASVPVEMGLPMLVTWVAPVYPPEAASRKLEGRVHLRVIIDETGAVTQARAMQASDPMFADAAIQAARQWRFEPASEDGKAVAKCIDLSVPFEPANPKRPGGDSKQRAQVMASLAYPARRPAVKQSGGDPDYPESLLARHLPGDVLVDFAVDAQGHATGLTILGATHADFIQPALLAAQRWSFKPAQQGDLPVAATMKGSLEFSVLDVEKADVLAANGVTLEASPATGDPAALDQKPQLGVVVDPVYPYDQLVAGTEGEAVVGFVIQANGRVGSVTVRQASQPDFGRALAAAVESWLFRPARREGGNVAVAASLRQKFSLAAASGWVPPVARLAQRLHANDTEGMGPKGLDARLNPRFRAPPEYPEALLGEQVAGSAEIEFIIDREGRGRAARIVSASRDEFGWAAATAVERWVFDPPRRNGEAVDVRVRIPFEFAAPPPTGGG